MFKFLGAISLITASALFGYYKAYSFKNRISFLNDYISFLNQAKDIVAYCESDIITVFENVIVNDPLKSIINSTIKNLPNENSFYCAFEKAVNKSAIFKEDKALLYNFAKCLGTTDLDGQISNFMLSRTFAEKALIEAEEQYKIKGKLYKTLGTSFGLAISVLLI